MGDMELLVGEVGGVHEFETDIVEALEGAHGGGADGGAAAAVGKETLDGAARDEDILGVHLVTLHLLALDGTEGAGTDMEGDLVALDALGVKGAEDSIGEMEASGGGSHGTVNLGIDGLVGALVALLGGTVEVGGDGQLAGKLEDFGEGEGGCLRFEI